MTFFKLKNTTERYCTLFSFEVGMINLKCFYKIIRRAVLFFRLFYTKIQEIYYCNSTLFALYEISLQ